MPNIPVPPDYEEAQKQADVERRIRELETFSREYDGGTGSLVNADFVDGLDSTDLVTQAEHTKELHDGMSIDAYTLQGNEPNAFDAAGTAAQEVSDHLTAKKHYEHIDRWETGTAYVVEDLVTAYGSVWRCVGAHTSSGEHLDTSKFVRMTGYTPWTVGSVVFVGHSYVDTGEVDEGLIGRRYFPGRMMTALGLSPFQITNLAVSGSTARWHAYLTLQGVNPGNVKTPYLQATQGLGVVWYGGNDAIQGYTDDTWVEWTFKRGYHSIISRLRAGAVFENDDPSVAYTGTWIAEDWLDTWNYKAGSGDGYKRSVTVGDKIKITTHDQVGVHKEGVWVQLGFIGGKSGAAATVKVDGVLDGYLDVGRGTSYGTAFSQSTDTYVVPYTYRLWLPTTHNHDDHYTVETHEIEIEITGGVVSDGLIFDYWAVEADDPPVTLCLSTISPSNARSVWANLANPDVIAKYNEWTREVIAEFTLDDGTTQDETVRYVDVNYVIGGYEAVWSKFSNEKYFGHDGLHPNPIGGQLITEACLEELNNAMNAPGVGSRNLLGKSSFERDPLWRTPKWSMSTIGQPVTPLDEFERGASEDDFGNANATVYCGAWGIDEWGQAKIVDSAWQNLFVWADDFGRADANTLGTVSFARSGTHPTWTAGRGTWEIVSGKAEMTAKGTTPGPYPHVTFDTGSNVHWIEAKMTSVANNVDVGVIVRFYDSSNYVFFTFNLFGFGLLYKVVGGVVTNVASGSGYSQPHVEVDSSHVVRVYNADGGQPTIEWTIPVGDTNLRSANATSVGLWGNTQTGIKYDNVKAGSSVVASADEEWGQDVVVWDTGSADGAFGIKVGDDGTEIPEYYGFCWRVEDADNYMRAAYDSQVFGAWVVQKVVAGVTDESWVYWANAEAGDEIIVQNIGDSIKFYKNAAIVNELNSGDPEVFETNALLTGTEAGLMANHVKGEPTARWRAFLWGEDVSTPPNRSDIFLDKSDPRTVILYGPYDRFENGWGSGIDITPDVIDGGSL